jgi:hypothetical protein
MKIELLSTKKKVNAMEAKVIPPLGVEPRALSDYGLTLTLRSGLLSPLCEGHVIPLDHEGCDEAEI